MASLDIDKENIRIYFIAWRRFTRYIRQKRVRLILQWQQAVEFDREKTLKRFLKKWREVYALELRKSKQAEIRYRGIDANEDPRTWDDEAEENSLQKLFEKWRVRYNTYSSLGEMVEDEYNTKLLKMAFYHWRRLYQQKKSMEQRADEILSFYFLFRTIQILKTKSVDKPFATSVLAEWLSWAVHRKHARDEKAVNRVQSEVTDTAVSGTSLLGEATMAKYFALWKNRLAHIRRCRGTAKLHHERNLLKKAFNRFPQVYLKIRHLSTRCSQYLAQQPCKITHRAFFKWSRRFHLQQLTYQNVIINYEKTLTRKAVIKWSHSLYALRRQRLKALEHHKQQMQQWSMLCWRQRLQEQKVMAERADSVINKAVLWRCLGKWRALLAGKQKAGTIATNVYNAHLLKSRWTLWKTKLDYIRKNSHCAVEAFHRNSLRNNLTKWRLALGRQQRESDNAVLYYTQKLLNHNWDRLKSKWKGHDLDNTKMKTVSDFIMRTRRKKRKKTHDAYRFGDRSLRPNTSLVLSNILSELPKHYSTSENAIAIYDFRLVNTCLIIWRQRYHNMRMQREASTYYITKVLSRAFKHWRDRCQVNQEINYLESLRPFTRANSERIIRKHGKAQKIFLLRAYFYVWRKRAEAKVIQSYEESVLRQAFTMWYDWAVGSRDPDKKTISEAFSTWKWRYQKEEAQKTRAAYIYESSTTRKFFSVWRSRTKKLRAKKLAQVAHVFRYQRLGLCYFLLWRSKLDSRSYNKSRRTAMKRHAYEIF
ncbi:3970_t:CDS:10 [Paraglomus occultum]|uniref:3970_t:CDS:1 n=1 Tax=Paraglomus occultum TaxID=144539 RepID=A0A9N9FIA1_9GLOM|nr:3970_t:CDS:10 [Paraglomus occultum]